MSILQRRGIFFSAGLRGIVFGSLFLVLGVLGGLYWKDFLSLWVKASDTTYSWTFSNPSEYVVSDTSLTEVAGNSGRLRVRNYESDANTGLLLHLDESSGNPVDSSSHNQSAVASNLSYVTGKFNNGSTLNTSRISVDDSSAISMTGAHTLESWIKFNAGFSLGSADARMGLIDKGDYQLYFDNETGKLTYEMANNAANTWTQVGGSELNGSWDVNGQLNLASQIYANTKLYVGTGNSTGDAEVWEWNGVTWTQIGGDGVGSSWSANTYESALSMAADSTYLYVGLGLTASDGEVWRYTFSNGVWLKIGGNSLNSGWTNGYEGVYSMKIDNGTLYAGVGASSNDAEVWAWNGTSWTKIGGDSLKSGWTTTFETVFSLETDGTYLYAGLGASTGDAEVWRYSYIGDVWNRIGGDGDNSGWANSTYESVYALKLVGSNLFAGIGTGAGDAEVWRWNGTSWTKIGGNSLNSGWTTGYDAVWSMAYDGTYLYAGLGSSGGENEVWRTDPVTVSWTQVGGDGIGGGFGSTTHTAIESLTANAGVIYAGITSNNGTRTSQVWALDGGSWTQLGGDYVNGSWGFRGVRTVETLVNANGKLYAGMGYNDAGNALVWEYDGDTWRLIGGQGNNSSWVPNAYEMLISGISYKGDLYVGLGVSANDAEVWKWNGTTWSQIGGDSLNGGWTTNFEEVDSLAVVGDTLYAGLGASANDAEVWAWNGTDWTKIGGDSLNGGWTTNYERVTGLTVYENKLYAGLGSSANDAEVWRWDDGSWTKMGGDGVNDSWTTGYEQVEVLATSGKLYAGLGTSSGDAEVWEWNGSGWSLIGGNEVNNSWTFGTYERVRTMINYNGYLYAGLGNTTNDGEVWRWDGTTWTQIGGDLLNSGWSNTIEEVISLAVYKGKLYSGIGSSQNVDASVWSYGNNGFLQSNVSSWDTNWNHVAGTYDGTTMKLYVNGVVDATTVTSQLLPDSSRSLLIGSSYGARSNGRDEGYFKGMMDEVRISNVTRSSFINNTYTTDAQTIRPLSAVMTSQVEVFDSFSAVETTNGGTINYRLSDNGGSSWKYYSGGNWIVSTDLTQVNSASVINTNLLSFPVGSGGIMWQAVLIGNGSLPVYVSDVTVGAIADAVSPENPSSLISLSNVGGSAISTNNWYGHSAPYFSWSGASDDGAGVDGYYVYYGTDNTAEPQTAGVYQTGTTYTAGSMVGGTTYYLRIKAKDKAGNYAGDIWSPFVYKYDSSAPNNPPGVAVNPAGYAAMNSFTFSWQAGTDNGAGIAGYQYKTGASEGVLADWSSTISATTVSLDDAAYTSGQNVFYLRTVDNAGNVSASTLQVSYYFAGDGPSAPQNLTVSPESNTTNSFAFSWQAPASHSGTEGSLTYCYTVNTLPSELKCTYTSPGATALSASSFATQVGLNVLYLVAKNSSEFGGVVNYGAHASVSFTANTAAPGVPLNPDIADVSVKNSSSWKLAVSWEPPSDSGSGVSVYEIYRSDDDVSYERVASTTGIAYVDTGLLQKKYYYKVRGCDNVNNCGVYTTPVSELPTGKYTVPPALSSGPVVSAVTTKQATISWGTDRVSDSKVQYGISAGSYYESEPSNSLAVTDHTIVLANLSPGTTYFFVTKWTDEDGNTGVSTEKSFTTDPAPSVKDVQIKSLGLSGANIQFISMGASKVKVYYGETTGFGGVLSLETSTAESTYVASLEDLKDGVKYYYQINAFDSEDAEYEGTILSFTTLPRPKISNVRIDQVKNSAQPSVLVTWTTNTKTSSIATFFPQSKPELARDEVNVDLKQGAHQLLVKGLNPETTYVLIVKGRDGSGNEAQSDQQTFTTATDTRPALITNLQVQGDIQTTNSGQDATAQLVVTWTTDEPATSQVEFGEGTGSVYAQKTQEDANMTLDHMVVVTNLVPSRVYHLRAVSKDKASNQSVSIDTVTITPKVTESALNLVISNLQQVFGFLSVLQQ